MAKQEIKIPKIVLDWTEWIGFESIEHISKDLLPKKEGVYEVKLKKDDVMLTIGKSTNLRKRIRRGLVLGKVPHSTGKLIRKYEKKNISDVVVRWALTDRCCAVEEELHIKYKRDHNNELPRYTKIT